jgi:hypothetical protein
MAVSRHVKKEKYISTFVFFTLLTVLFISVKTSEKETPFDPKRISEEIFPNS